MSRVLKLSTSRSYVQEVLADNPAAYWRLGEAVGATTFADSSRNQLTAADLVGAPTLGVAGALLDGNTAMTFAGVADAVKYTGAPMTQTTGFWTIEAWVYPTAQALQTIYQNGGAANGFGMQLSAIDELSVFTRNVGTNVSALSVVTQNAWNYVVTQDDGVNHLFWINGQFKQAVTRQAPGGVDTSESNIGRFTNGAYARYYTGRIDEVAVYKTVLSPERIKAHYRAGTRR